LICFILFFTGLSDAVNVIQLPSSVLKRAGEVAELTCEHDSSSYDRMFWYQQTGEMKDLKLIGYLFTTIPDYEQGMQNKFTISGDGAKKGSLTISKLRAEDTATYFCAASQHGDTEGFIPHSKNQSYSPSFAYSIDPMQSRHELFCM
ncbi:KV06 protein, partial [Polypterus senegalus]|nr:KV06 protein [Polypterus senegalus]